MAPKPHRPRSGFTLIELLVVVGIIALLVALVLPSLSSARATSKTTKCMANIRSVGMAMLQYIDDNDSALPPVRLKTSGSAPWTTGWFWANELVRQNFIVSTSGVDGSGNTILGPSAFRCPSTLDEYTANSNPSLAAPSSPINNMYTYEDYPANSNRVAIWYTLNGSFTASNKKLNNSTAQPFLVFDTSAGGSRTDVSDNRYFRSRKQLEKQASAVMIVEGNAVNLSGASRIAARHGSFANGARNGLTNMFFFDGHVATLPTDPYDKADLAGTDALSLTNHKVTETIFYISEAK